MNTTLTFLLIDDDEDDRELFELALDSLAEKPNFYSASGCRTALTLLEEGTVKPDFIFLDLNMPQISGRECLMALKNNVRFSHIPVVIFSTSSDAHDKIETSEMGAVDFITKPPKISELTRILNEFIINQASLSSKK